MFDKQSKELIHEALDHYLDTLLEEGNDFEFVYDILDLYAVKSGHSKMKQIMIDDLLDKLDPVVGS